MDFGDILNEWDKIKKERGSTRAEDRERRGDEDPRPEDREEESRRLSSMRPQAVLDLHGMTAEEARTAIDRFIDSSSRAGLEKVLLIHGKGLHSEGGLSVLTRTAREAVEAHPLAGRYGQAAREDGGSGALWLIVRRRRSKG